VRAKMEWTSFHRDRFPVRNTASRLAIAAATASLLVLAATQGAAGAVTQCPTDGYHWYGAATAPVVAGTSNGSYITEVMPFGYHVGSQGGVDEATWVTNSGCLTANENGNYTCNGAWELGWFQGDWFYATSYTYYYNPHAYDTTFDGHLGYLLSQSDLPEGGYNTRYLLGGVDTTCPYRQIYNLTAQTEFYHSTSCFGSSIVVPTPRDNYSQGEVASTQLLNDEGGWMGGNNGNGLVSYGYYEQYSSGNYYPWASFSTCDNTPYWITTQSANSWENGGTG
jgi:hypothetical protein